MPYLSDEEIIERARLENVARCRAMNIEDRRLLEYLGDRTGDPIYATLERGIAAREQVIAATERKLSAVS
jgi:hypothetical protein